MLTHGSCLGISVHDSGPLAVIALLVLVVESVGEHLTVGAIRGSPRHYKTASGFTVRHTVYRRGRLCGEEGLL